VLGLSYCLFALPCAAADEQKDMTVTLDSGKSYKRARLLRKEGDILVFVHSTGIAKVQWQLLSDESRAALGYTTREEEMARARAKAEEEAAKAEADKAKAEAETKAKAEFAAQQQKKGLIEYDGLWVTPEQKKELVAEKEIDRMMKEKAPIFSYEVLQVLEEKGALCKSIDYEFMSGGNYNGNKCFPPQWNPGYTFFLSLTDTKLIGEGYRKIPSADGARLYWGGTYDFMDTTGVRRVVDKYAKSEEEARRLLKEELYQLTQEEQKPNDSSKNTQKTITESDNQLDKMIDEKAVIFSYKIFQVVKGNGALCLSTDYEYISNGDNRSLPPQWRPGYVFFLIRDTKLLTEGYAQPFKSNGDSRLYWAGTYTYLSKQGASRTVDKYAQSKIEARRLLRDQLYLPPPPDEQKPKDTGKDDADKGKVKI